VGDAVEIDVAAGEADVKALDMGHDALHAERRVQIAEADTQGAAFAGSNLVADR